MDDLVRDWKHVVFFRCYYVTDSDLSFLSLSLPNRMEEEGEKWSGIELIVAAVASKEVRSQSYQS